MKASRLTSIALVNKTAPYGQANGQESLDLALAAGSFGQDIRLYFIEDGVFQLLAKQSPGCIDAKNYSKTFAALTFYDIEHIYVCRDSLKARSLEPKNLCIEVEVLSKNELQQHLSLHQHILSF